MKLKKFLSTLSVMMFTFSFSMSNSVAVQANDTDISNFSYTGAVQTFTAPYSGKYKLEVWGAEGGMSQSNRYGLGGGGKGGYSCGKIYLTKGQILYLYVGGKGGDNPVASGGGGGATDIRMNGTSYSNRVIVAGGGGGAGGNDGNGYGRGGAGGGLLGINGTPIASDFGYGGTQLAGGGTTRQGSVGSLGQGGQDPTWTLVNNGGWNGGGSGNGEEGGGGGGGYYGGGTPFSGNYGGGAGGGSGYIGTLASATTIAGNQSFQSPSGTTEIGQSGNGYARITHVASYANGITINKRADDLEVGETDKLTARVIPDNASVKTVKWTSSDPSVVTVDDNGNIAAVKAGTAIITATVQDGRNLHGQCRVCVTD